MTKLGQAALLATEVRTLKSKATGKTYKISIALPLAYHNDEPVKFSPFDELLEAWPTVYVLDPDSIFGMTTDMIRYMSWWHRTNDAVIVGIGYPEEGSIQSTWQKTLASRT